MSAWHTKPAVQVLDELGSDRRRGLSQAEAQRRLEQYGPNELEHQEGEGFFARFLGQMKDPMILVLLSAAALSLWASGGEDWIDAVIILVIVVGNALISISQVDNAQKALEALRKMSAPMAKAVREGRNVRVESARLVPGDLIRLEAGDLVPADARVLECANLKADESAMTGESAPVSKAPADRLPPDTPLADRSNMVIAATVITSGRCTAVITGTGMNTEVGRIAGLLMDEETAATPLQRKMAEISKTLSFVCLCVCAVMFGVGLLQGKEILDMFMTAVSLAVAAIPEGLPGLRRGHLHRQDRHPHPEPDDGGGRVDGGKEAPGADPHHRRAVQRRGAVLLSVRGGAGRRGPHRNRSGPGRLAGGHRQKRPGAGVAPPGRAAL